VRGSLALRHGVLYVGRHEGSAHVRPYDLDGVPLSDGFSFRGPDRAAVELAGFAVDPDHRVWVADARHAAIRRFTLVGRETDRWRANASGDALGAFGTLVDLEIAERDGDLECWIASGGWRRHAIQLCGDDGEVRASLRSEGEPHSVFQGVARIARDSQRLYVCEPHARRVQVFRGLEFEFAFRLAGAARRPLEPVALAPLDDGRMVVACGGEESALVLVDRGGRVERVLAEGGEGVGRVLDPTDVVAEPGGEDRSARIAVIDRSAERVQVFTLEGRCQGALAALPGD
jgi:sugar lactone lactonase YvrE